ncbi:MAG TPA: hypothetical protein VHS30_02975, partial [Streptosporangiaceae bacterium]|nr:hypothetical protein [Streptosporangiaceae bacterium]
MSDVEAPLATRAAILISVGVSASQPKAARPPLAHQGVHQFPHVQRIARGLSRQPSQRIPGRRSGHRR